MKKKPVPEEGTSDDIVTSNLGIIAGRAIKYWPLLPMSVKAYYDVEDMISDCALQVVRASKHFDPTRSKTSTFVWWVANNQCLSTVARYRTAKFSAEVLPIDEFLFSHFSRPDSNITLKESLSNVERLLEAAVDSTSDLADFLEVLFSGTEVVAYQKRDFWKAQWPEEVLKEFRELMARYHVSYEDLQTVLAGI